MRALSDSVTRRLCQGLRILSIVFYFLILPVHGKAFAEEPINISADHLEYFTETNTYMAKGSVNIRFEDISIRADEVYFNNNTMDAIANGNVIYENTETIIRGDRAKLNVETRLGEVYNSYVFYKKNNYHLRGGTLTKTGKRSYTMDRATVTTCDAHPPAWHISGRNVEAEKHKSIKAKHTAFYIRGMPVLYTPYFWMPLLKRRQTGLLIPSIGYSNKKGFMYRQGFFWAIKEDRDITFYIDYYGKKGLGKGMDYRYVRTEDEFGELWMYHLRDTELLRDFFEIKSYHNKKFPYDSTGYLTLHLVNEFDYYDELGSTSMQRIGMQSKPNPFHYTSEERLQKYLESNLHISRPSYGGRVYILARYRQSLEGSSGAIPQSLPEIGLAINTRSLGPLSFNVQMRGTNFWRDEGQKGQRFDINPNIYLSYGRTVTLTQRVGVRETAYFLTDPAQSKNRLIFDVGSTLTTRFLRRYSSFIHIIEPSLEYTYIPAVDQKDIPVFDSIDSIPQTSNISYSFTNRLEGIPPFYLKSRFRISQGYSLLDTDEPFTPVLAEGSLSGDRIDLNLNASYDVYDHQVIDTIASIKFKGRKGYIGLGKNYRVSTDLDQYTIEAGLYRPITIYRRSIPMELHGKLWYDVKGRGVQEMNIRTIYNRQCWGLTISLLRKPEEYQIIFGIQFRGLGGITAGYPEVPAVFSDPYGKTLTLPTFK